MLFHFKWHKFFFLGESQIICCHCCVLQCFFVKISYNILWMSYFNIPFVPKKILQLCRHKKFTNTYVFCTKYFNFLWICDIFGRSTTSNYNCVVKGEKQEPHRGGNMRLYERIGPPSTYREWITHTYGLSDVRQMALWIYIPNIKIILSLPIP